MSGHWHDDEPCILRDDCPDAADEASLRERVARAMWDADRLNTNRQPPRERLDMLWRRAPFRATYLRHADAALAVIRGDRD